MPRIKKEISQKTLEKKTEMYIEGVGRRKTAVARVRIYPQSKENGNFLINNKNIEKYFPLEKHRKIVLAPFEVLNVFYKMTVKVVGGGVNAQAEAIRHGLSRALVKMNEENRKILKPYGFLKRDPRMVERKHYGLRKARRAQQWRKR